MKITIVQGAFLPVPPIRGGAVEKVWFALGQEFVRRGHEVVHISRALPDLPRWEIISGVTHVRIPGSDTPASLWRLKLLDLLYSIRARAALPNESDIIVTNTFWLPMLLRSGRRGKVYVHVARFPKGQMRFYRHCARLQAPSQAVARAIIAEAPTLVSKVRPIPYPRPEPIDPTLPPFASRPRTILYVGRIHPEKGVHLLLEAFDHLALDLPADWRLRIVGPWESALGGGGEAYWQRLQLLARKAGPAVELAGPNFDPPQLEQEFRSARLFVYPSLAEKGETFGMAPLEAMTNGCAVLVSDLGCFHDFIEEGETGFFFDHHRENVGAALRLKLERLLSDDALLEQVAATGHAQSAELLLSKVAAKYLADFQLLTQA